MDHWAIELRLASEEKQLLELANNHSPRLANLTIHTSCAVKQS